MLAQSSEEIRRDWPKYRCNPAYWIYSTDLSADFRACVQSTQTNLMGYLLEPTGQAIGGLTQVGGSLSSSLNDMRTMISNLRSFVSTIVDSVFGVFVNLVIEFQRMTISIKDMMGKLVGVMATIMYVLDGSVKTMQSAWAGPPGQTVKAVGSCFHPDQLVRFARPSDTRVHVARIADLQPGDVLPDNTLVLATMRVLATEPLFRLATEDDPLIPHVLVTGSHIIRHNDAWIHVRDLPPSIATPTTQRLPVYISLITSTHTIPIASHTFYDWEDDHVSLAMT